MKDEAMLDFYTKFIQHFEDDPSFMQCGPLDTKEFTRLRTRYKTALEKIM